MKNKRKSATSSQSEACGVWLDTAAGKKRSVQTLLASSTYKLQTPFLMRALSGAAVQYDFTQTRTPQLCTLQTSIASFFRTTSPGELNRSSPDNACKKRKCTGDVLGSSSKKNVTAEHFSPHWPADGGLSFKHDWNQLSIPPTESQESVTPASNVAEFMNISLLTPPSDFDRLESRGIWALESSLLPDSLIQPGNPDTHPESPALTEPAVLVNRTSRGLYDFPRFQLPSMNADACAPSAGGSSPRVGSNQTQIDFTQDSEGNVVLAHRLVPASRGSIEHHTGPERSVAGGGTDVRKKRDTLSTKQCSKYLANADVGLEAKENLPRCELSDSCTPDLENLRPAEVRTGQASNRYILNSLPDEEKVQNLECLQELSQEILGLPWVGVFSGEGSTEASVEINKCQHVPVRPHRGSQGHPSSKYPKSTGQKTPLADRTNQLQDVEESGTKTSSAIPLCSGSGDPLATPPPLGSLLFTQDSEGNNVIKHW